MKIDLYLHPDLMINEKLDRILKILEGKMSVELDNLTQQVAANTDAEQSAILLLTQLHDLLVNAGTNPDKLNELTNLLATSKNALASAIVANTPLA